MTSPAPDLDALLVAAASSPNDQAAVRRFTDALLDATVGWLLNDGGQGLVPVTLPFQGSTMVPFFSTPDKARHAVEKLQRPGGADYPILARELFNEAVRHNIVAVLNPFSDYGKNFTVSEMSDLLAGVTPGTQTRIFDKPTKLMIGVPAHVTPGLIDALTDHLRALDGVESGTLAWVRYPDGLQGYLLVVVTDLSRETVTAGIERPARLAERTLDVLVNSRSAGAGIAKSVEPFYRSS